MSKPKHVATVTQSDVGTWKATNHNGTKRGIYNVIGRVLQCDVGKRVYIVNGVYQIENNEQLKRRIG